ncbi:MAG: nucleotide sugar dehydrogenase [Syntrophomonadaceae bacterium]|nr:nucleotide sugar dehydrogenase [Syntrophomonadaceae bacterium]MDD3023371.1 nucleotide sugar dehydrogenase [Syntrophomonadaceae bacterium]
MQRICILGLGYIGLPTAAILASHGKEVIGVDTDRCLLELLGEGKVPINEPELEPMIKKCRQDNNLKLRLAPEEADVFIVAVPTPCKEDKNCDLSSVINAVISIIPCLKSGNLLVIESTIPPGTCDEFISPLLNDAGFRTGEDIHLAFCPERVLPGQILQELIGNSRIIGGYTPACARMAADLYKVFVKNEIILTDLKTAEMVKLAENTYRDANIALANEFTLICNYLAIDAVKVIDMANKHPRVNILNPGPGVGGHCLAVDPYFIVQKAPSLARIISAARSINKQMPGYIAAKVKGLINGVKFPKIAVLGLSYKGNVADLRESPALEIVNLLIEEGLEIMIFDPHFREDKKLNELAATVKNADLILILTDHSGFKTLDYIKLAENMRTAIIFDTRNMIDSEQFKNSKVSFYNMGNIFAANKKLFYD